MTGQPPDLTADDDHAPDLTPSATRWTRALASWGIPQPILDAAPADPWALPVATFTGRAERAVATPGGCSYERAVGALSMPGTILDVGCGVGAASLPLVPRAISITAIDTSQDMLDAFRTHAIAMGIAHQMVRGSWPTVAPQIAPHDVVLAYHVVYNVPAIGSFLVALTAHSTRRVVLELPPRHPLSWMTPLWERFHGISRPESPTSDDLVEVLREIGVADLTVEAWQQDVQEDGELDHERVAMVTQRLCLGPDRQPDVAEALRELDADHHRQLVTLSWAGSAHE